MTSNREFAEKLEIDISFASKLRNGQRLPSLNLMQKISWAYDIPLKELTDTYFKGRIEMGRFLRARVFDETTT